jgi:hypothetical protein
MTMKAPRIKIKAGTPRQMNADDDCTLEFYCQRVDAILRRAVGMSLYDLPDCPISDWYEDRVRPIYAANKALAYAEDF